jgi:hypothetical protein
MTAIRIIIQHTFSREDACQRKSERKNEKPPATKKQRHPNPRNPKKNENVPSDKFCVLKNTHSQKKNKLRHSECTSRSTRKKRNIEYYEEEEEEDPVRELKAHKNNTSELKNERKKESTGTK